MNQPQWRDPMATTTEDRLRELATTMRERGERFALIIPTEPTDDEWAVQLGGVQCVATSLDDVIDLALSYLSDQTTRAAVAATRANPVNAGFFERVDAERAADVGGP